jgi:hypothetical protein
LKSCVGIPLVPALLSQLSHSNRIRTSVELKIRHFNTARHLDWFRFRLHFLPKIYRPSDIPNLCAIASWTFQQVHWNNFECISRANSSLLWFPDSINRRNHPIACGQWELPSKTEKSR